MLNRPIVNKFTAIDDDGPRKLKSTHIGRLIIWLLKSNTAHWVISKQLYEECISCTPGKKRIFFNTKSCKNSLCFLPSIKKQ